MSSILFVAHPGHEIRLHHWMEQEKPVIFTLTDGSGGGGVSRLHSTERVLASAGVEHGSCFGEFTDKGLYSVIREQRIDDVLALADSLAVQWKSLGVTDVTADMMEGFNTAHDLVRFLCGAVVERLRRKDGMIISNWDFPLEGRPDRCLQEAPAGAECIRLNTDALGRKMAAAANYPELKFEVDRALESWGRDAFTLEVRRPAPQPIGLAWTDAERPYYEVHGEKMVQAGRYKEIITYQNHMQPLAVALWKWATD